MILNATNKRVEIVLGEAMTTTNCDITASWGDYTATAFTPGGASTVSNGTTAVVVAPAPATSTQRLVQEITLHNNDTVDHTVVLRLIDGAATRIFRRALVPAGGDLAYSPSLAVADADANYFSIVAGTPDTLILKAPPADALIIASDDNLNIGTNDAAASHTSALYSGNASAGASGQVLCYSGDAAAGNSGLAYFQSGNATGGNSGEAYTFSGDVGTGDSGAAGVGSGNVTAGTSGKADIYTGDSASGASGPANIGTGAASGATAGSINLSPGSVVAGNGNGGDVVFNAATGHGTGRNGLIFMAGLPTAAPATSGAIWRDAGAGNVLKCVP